MRDLDSSIKELESELDSVPDSEYSKRKAMIGDLSTKTIALKKKRKQRGNAAGKGALMGGSNASSGYHSPGAGPPQETTSTIGMSDSDLIQRQEQVLRQQDQDLDEIHAAVKRVNQIAKNVNDEGKLQDRLLDEIYDAQENVNLKMTREQSRMEKVLRSSGNGKGICLICLLVAAIVVCIIILKDQIF